MRSALVSLALLIGFGPACDSKDAAPAKQAEAKGEAKATPEPEPAAKAEPEPEPENYGSEFCATIIPCFEKFEFNGNFSADVSVDIETDGSVSAVSYTGEAPKPVQTCITDAVKAITLSDYNGQLGRTRCTQSGQLTGGSRMVMADYTYAIREAAEAPAE